MNVRTWYSPVTETAAADIIRKTRIPSGRNPDPSALAGDLNDIFLFCQWQWRLQFSTSRKAREAATVFASRTKRLNDEFEDPKFSSAIESFLIFGGHKLGAPNETYRQFGIEDIDPDTPLEFDQRVEFIVPRLFAAISLIAKWARAGIRQMEVGSPRSAIEILIGQGLPFLFEKHFKRSFGAGTAGDVEADGPGIRFVIACLKAGSITRSDGKPYSVETVRTYRQEFKAKKFRRSDKSRKKD